MDSMRSRGTNGSTYSTMMMTSGDDAFSDLHGSENANTRENHRHKSNGNHSIERQKTAEEKNERKIKSKKRGKRKNTHGKS